ncbi:MAG: hypothetical protein EPN25_01670 [Nitrospirae bacterium]|nr:MAG: hypothetical protein EPN25_01670 [Nitrospirota bacterium]
MEDDLLARVLSAEKEIQAYLDTERTKVLEWLERKRQEAEAEFGEEEHRLREEVRLSSESSRAAAITEAGKIIDTAEQRAAILLSIGDDTLKEIVMKRIGLILME